MREIITGLSTLWLQADFPQPRSMKGIHGNHGILGCLLMTSIGEKGKVRSLVIPGISISHRYHMTTYRDAFLPVFSYGHCDADRDFFTK